MGRLIAVGIVVGAALTHTLGQLPAQSHLWWSLGVLALVGAPLFYFSWRATLPRAIWLALVAGLLSMSWTTWQAQGRLADALASEHEGVVTRLTFRVVTMAQDQSDSQRFEAQVQDPRPDGIPRHIQVVWAQPQTQLGDQTRGASPVVIPGQTWRAALVLRRPHGASNPFGFDYEGWMFQRNVRAIGKVRGKPVLMADQPLSSFGIAVARSRHNMRSSLRRAVGHLRYGAVLIALAIGDQDSVRAEDWVVFNQTGITHLVSISGSHVTMIAAFGGLAMVWLWKKLRLFGRPVCERVPSRVAGALAALVVAWLYCLLAGWGVPARRTFFMLAVGALAVAARMPLAPSRLLCVAAAIVIIADPWSSQSTGFWLSFGAVAVLFCAGAQAAKVVAQAGRARHLWTILKQAARLQWIITLAMLPVLAFMFQQASASSPFANAIAIPVVTFIVTPLALITACLCVIPGLEMVAAAIGWLGHLALLWTMVPVVWLASVSWSTIDVAAVPWWWLLLALAGVAWALAPPGVPVRWAGWCLVGPALAWQPGRPAVGGWNLWALDVGQGSAILISTRQHNFLIDTGPAQGGSDAGQRVIVPVLRALGVGRLHTLVVSHADLDHAGGLASVLRAMPVQRAYASFDVEALLRKRAAMAGTKDDVARPGQTLRCELGQQWQVDGVTFSFLHPQPARQPGRQQEGNHAGYQAGDQASDEVSNTKSDTASNTKSDTASNTKSDTASNTASDKASSKTSNKARHQASNQAGNNARSCVLHVAGRHHSVLLPGDIGAREERLVLDSRAVTADQVRVDGFKADVVLVAHHGSATSSSAPFVGQLGARHAIAQVGHANRFGHPDRAVSRRWQQGGASFWRTDRDGAVQVTSSAQGMTIVSHRRAQERYWHGR